jgi:hypothetical protein
MHAAIAHAKNKKKGLIILPVLQAFSGWCARLVNVTSRTPFFKVFFIDAGSTGGSPADE